MPEPISNHSDLMIFAEAHMDTHLNGKSSERIKSVKAQYRCLSLHNIGVYLCNRSKRSFLISVLSIA
jgi:hypothetical protein